MEEKIIWKDYLSVRVLQMILLFVGIFFNSYYNNRSSIYMLSDAMPMETNAQFIFMTIIFSAAIVTALYYAFVNYAYYISNKIFKTMLKNKLYKESTINLDIRKLMSLPQFPISYKDFSFNLIWYLIIISVMTGTVRLLYFFYPFTYGILESFIPIIISVSILLLFFKNMRKKFIPDKIVGTTFLSLAVPYLVVIIILM